MAMWSRRRQAGSLIRTIGTTLVEGGQLARDETVEHRMAICRECAFLAEADNKCEVCGCRVTDDRGRAWLSDVGLKVAHRSSVCPIYKWLEEDQDMTEQDFERAKQKALEIEARLIALRARLTQLPDLIKKYRETTIPQLEEELAKTPELIEQANRELAELPVKITFSREEGIGTEEIDG